MTPNNILCSTCHGMDLYLRRRYEMRYSAASMLSHDLSYVVGEDVIIVRLPPSSCGPYATSGSAEVYRAE